MSYRILRFDFTDDAFWTIAERRDSGSMVLPDSFAEGMRSTSGGMTSLPLFESDPIAMAVRWELTGIDGVTEIDVTGEYTLARTQAGTASDGFGTIGGGTIDGWRIVAIKPEHYDWQVTRYETGCYAFKLAEAA